mmetsp:Transcript_9398/g.21749  ORF Transcript_9398/g.21749 Transcript_9398/m.21749 type:complete len:213 (+) Transcript_9398:363-1001(+)
MRRGTTSRSSSTPLSEPEVSPLYELSRSTCDDFDATRESRCKGGTLYEPPILLGRAFSNVNIREEAKRNASCTFGSFSPVESDCHALVIRALRSFSTGCRVTSPSTDAWHEPVILHMRFVRPSNSASLGMSFLYTSTTRNSSSSREFHPKVKSGTGFLSSSNLLQVMSIASGATSVLRLLPAMLRLCPSGQHQGLGLPDLRKYISKKMPVCS